MQILKEKRKQRILETAKQEFLAYGFEKTPVSAIAQNAGVATGNIYDYFKNKDEIFSALLHPIITNIERRLVILEKRLIMKKERLADFSWTQNIIRDIVRYFANNREYLTLLLFNAEGSTLASYRANVSERFTRILMLYSDVIQEKYPRLNTLSLHLARNISDFCVSMFEVVLAQDLSYEKMTEYADEATTFIWNGILAVIQRKKNTEHTKTP